MQINYPDLNLTLIDLKIESGKVGLPAVKSCFLNYFFPNRAEY